MKLSGKTSIVFGASGGERGDIKNIYVDIGKACTISLLQNGSKVTMADMAEEMGQSIAADLNKQFPDKVIFVTCDVTKQHDVDRAFTTAKHQLGNIQVCLNSVGVTMEKDWAKGMDVNFGGCVRITESAKKWMSCDPADDDLLHVIHVVSVFGLTAAPGGPIYTASKHAMVGYIRAIAANRQLSGLDGFRVNALCPYFVDTQMLVNPDALAPVELWNVIKEAKAKDNKLMSPDRVSEGMLQLIEDESLNGEFLMVHHYKGCFLDEATTHKFYAELM